MLDKIDRVSGTVWVSSRAEEERTMSFMNTDEQQMYFHGTDADLPIGAILVPGAALENSKDHGRSDHVYLTCDGGSSDGYDVAVREALGWARTACMVAEDDGNNENPTAFVYIVEPLGEVEPDNAIDDQVGSEAVRTTSARIVGVLDHYDLELYLPSPCYGPTYLAL